MSFFARFIFWNMIFCIAIVNKANSQLCTGSLGDPIVNITFGAGNNPGPSLTAAATNYIYQAADCPSDGFYTVRNSSVACFADSWHSLATDHTGNSGGYFMLVNASLQPSAFYLETVRGLCGNTTYEFAAWVMNMLKPGSCNNAGIQPNLTFSIEKTDGTVLQTYNSGNIPPNNTPTWKQFGFFFTTPLSVSDIVLRIVNNSSGGCGNDLALDDITFRPCGPKLTPTIIGSSSNTIKVCEGSDNTYTFSCMVSPGFNSPVFQWQQSVSGSPWTDIPGETGTALTKAFPATLAPGMYSLRLAAAEAGNLSSAQCRVLSEPMTIVINANPVVTISTNTPVCAGNTLTMTATGGAQYTWTGVNNFSASGATVSVPNAQPSQSGMYQVNVMSTEGCKKDGATQVNIYDRPVAATAFSSVSICKGDNVQLSVTGGNNYKWIPSAGLSADNINNPYASPGDTTLYRAIAFNQFACSDTVDVLVNVAERPIANAGPDKYILDVRQVQLTGKASGQDISYTWTPPIFINDANSLQPIVSPPADTSYILKVHSNVGCGDASDTVRVYVLKDIFIPSAFSPNNNSINDTWNIPGLNALTEYEISVFNRQGQLIFHTKNVPKPWDGRYKGVPQPVGVYVYMIDIKNRGIVKGTITLIR